jgi:hypothetical protein
VLSFRRRGERFRVKGKVFIIRVAFVVIYHRSEMMIHVVPMMQVFLGKGVGTTTCFLLIGGGEGVIILLCIFGTLELLGQLFLLLLGAIHKRSTYRQPRQRQQHHDAGNNMARGVYSAPFGHKLCEINRNNQGGQ